MKYNRAFILHNEESTPLINKFIEDDCSEEQEMGYWLKESGESFHGRHDDEYFYFKDSRIGQGVKLQLKYVKLEFSQEELEK